MVKPINTIIRTDSSHKDFAALVKLLDEYLTIVDGDEHAFYDQYNKVDAIKNVVILYSENEAVACGAYKPFDAQTVEIKRMYVLPTFRNLGYAKLILSALEDWAIELGFTRSILETGIRQAAAVHLYQSCNYHRIANYGQYTGIENSVCFEKQIYTKNNLQTF